MGCECEDPFRIRLEIVRSHLRGMAVATVEASRLSHGRGSSEMHRGRHVNVSPSSCLSVFELVQDFHPLLVRSYTESLLQKLPVIIGVLLHGFLVTRV